MVVVLILVFGLGVAAGLGIGRKQTLRHMSEMERRSLEGKLSEFRRRGRKLPAGACATGHGTQHCTTAGYPGRAVLTGFEPAVSCLTGRRGLQAPPQDLAWRVRPVDAGFARAGQWSGLPALWPSQ
jgi:hypothetical protein